MHMKRKRRYDTKYVVSSNSKANKNYYHLTLTSVFRIFIGIKKLLALVDMVKQTDEEYRVFKFLTKMQEEGGLDLGTTIQ